MDDLRKIETYGQMQVRLEAALAQLASVSYSVREMVNKTGGDDRHVRYHLKAAEEYVSSTWQAMAEFWGNTDGQLCPYKDCSRDLAFEHSGWWLCPNCKRPFWAGTTDSDYEDFHAYCPSEQRVPPDITEMKWARDLGPSWASPDA